MSGLSPLKDRILFDIRTIVTLTDGGEMRLADAIVKEVEEYAAQEANKALGEVYLNLPIVDDLEHPLQQSWKLGGTDIESYKRGHSDASTKAMQAVSAKARVIQNKLEGLS